MRTKWLPGITIGGVLIVILLVSCGGGGGGGSGGGSNPTQGIPLKTNFIRKINPGDTWNYSLTGSGFSYVDPNTKSNLFGTINIKILPDFIENPNTHNKYLDEYIYMEIWGPTGDPFIGTYFKNHVFFNQDSSGSIYEYGRTFYDLNDYWTPSSYNSDCSSLKSPMEVGQKYGCTIIYKSLVGPPINKFEVSVNNIEYVSTGIGLLEAYKITVKSDLADAPSFNWSDHYAINSTIWYVPGIGKVKIIEDLYYYWDGFFYWALSTTATLDNTSVIY